MRYLLLLALLLSLPAAVVKPLLNQQATREAILKSATQAASRVQSGGIFWLVYIGHGAPARSGKEGLLVGVDAQQTADSLQARGLSQRELLSAIESALAPDARAVLVLDACFSGKTSSGDLAPGLAPLNPVSARVSSTRTTVLTVRSSGGDGLSGSDIQALLAAKRRREAAEAEEAALK
ncbi:MAG: caspase family protein, partial [Oligoflexia bacterium]|nr:caspase family protein [Oligoflexia bacterium]